MFAERTNWQLTPNRLSLEVERLRRQGVAILDLTESNPTRCGLNYNSEEILRALADPRSLVYEPNPHGAPEARQAIAEYYAERNVAVDPECIFLTASTSEAYSYVFRLLASVGESILVPTPSYPLFNFLADLNDLRIVPYPLVYDQGWRLDRQALESRLHPGVRALLAVHPNNPTGSFLTRDDLEFLTRCCRTHSLALVSDEVFADYALEPDTQRVSSVAQVSGVLSFTLSGLSKIAALPQIKAAWIVANGPPETLRNARDRLEVIADTYLSVSTPVGLALPRLLEMRRSLQPQILERLRDNLHFLDEQLAGDSPVSRLRVEGGWYVILKLPSIRSDEEWALLLLGEDGVFVHPGHFFDFPSDGHLVLSLLPPAKTFQEGTRRILERVRDKS